MKPVRNFNRGRKARAGFTLIELMIVVAIIAIILSMALPTYLDYTIRAKVGEALSVGAAAKTAVAATCIEDPTINPVDNAAAGYDYATSEYVVTILASGPCVNPVITITTQNTGASPDIVITLTGDLNASRSRVDWTCTANSLSRNVPLECRS